MVRNLPISALVVEIPPISGRPRVQQRLETKALAPHFGAMNYILALLLPPLSILFSGRPFLAIITLLIWIPAIFFSGGLTHPMFIILAWLIIFEGRRDRAH